MKCVDEVLCGYGFYQVLLRVIDLYDGDTHIDECVKKEFTINVIQTLDNVVTLYRRAYNNHLPRLLHEPYPRQLLAVLLATHSRNRECLLFAGNDSYEQWPVRVFLDEFYNLKPRYNIPNSLQSSCRIDEERKIIETCHICVNRCPEITEPAYQKFIFYVPHSEVSSFHGFHVFKWTNLQ